MPENPTLPLRAKYLEIASGYVGLHETDGMNHGPFVEEFCKHAGLRNPQPPHQGYAYCALAQRLWFDKACAELGLPVPFEISPSVPQLVADAKAARRFFTNPLDAMIGDLIIWRTLQPGGGYQSHHVEVLTGALMPGQPGLLGTIGANTSPGDGSINEGGGIYRRWRPWRWFENVAHPKQT